jgi:hypothetical protein
MIIKKNYLFTITIIFAGDHNRQYLPMPLAAPSAIDRRTKM